VGLGEGVAPSGATDMVARVIAKNERARAISFIFSGLHVGSLLGLLVAPPLIENFGWEVVFYIFGIAGGLGRVGRSDAAAGRSLSRCAVQLGRTSTGYTLARCHCAVSK
jgi:MFS family permease